MLYSMIIRGIVLMKYKCVVVDLDQTLLREDKSLSQKTIDAFAKLPPETEIVVATGRAIIRTQRYADLIHARSMICTNGSIVYHQGEVIHRTEIDNQKVIDLIQVVRKIEPVHITLFYPTQGYTTNEYYINKGESLRLDLDHFETHEIQKIFIVTSNHAAVEAIDFSSYGMKAVPLTENPDIFVITADQVNKGSALRALCDHLGLDLSEVVAFGDDYNDLEMLQEAGCGVAMANAVGEISASADQHTLSNEDDGVAWWLEKHLADFQ